MWRKINLLSAFFISAFLLLYAPSVGICSESRTYQISESELLTLEAHLNALETNNDTLRSLLSESDSGLTIALEALMKSQNELETLRTQLEKARLDAQSAKLSLQTANQELAKAAQSFKQYEKERDRTENRLRNQRNIWEVLFFVACGVAAAK